MGEVQCVWRTGCTAREQCEKEQRCTKASLNDRARSLYLPLSAGHATDDICDRLARLRGDVLRIHGVDISDQVEDLIQFYRDGGDTERSAQVRAQFDVNDVMQRVQEYASLWSLVASRFDQHRSMLGRAEMVQSEIRGLLEAQKHHIPAILFDSATVWKEVQKTRNPIDPMIVSDVLDAIVMLMKAEAEQQS